MNTTSAVEDPMTGNPEASPEKHDARALHAAAGPAITGEECEGSFHSPP
jgi:hypothetical protein